MRIADLFRGDGPVFSFEFFPPHTPRGARSLMRTIDELRALDPAFVSVTYPLDRSRRHLTLELVATIKSEAGLEAMAHLTRVNASHEEIRGHLERLADDGIENVLALGGDPPPPDQIAVPEQEWFRHASDLAAFVRERFSFCIGGAAHPEGHVDSPDLDTDIAHLRLKVAAGCEFLITQLFFSNDLYFDFVARARAAGIAVPIIPGIMPITSVSGVRRMTAMSGASIPAGLESRLGEIESDAAAVEELGVAWALDQSRDLIARGAPGIHFYTLNRSTATRRILSALREH
jgi:methylenetetrahydrofolate reductase (NADPH)